MARNNEPALRRKTPLLICSIRTEIPYPWVGSRANVFRMSISSVPWTRSLGFSGIESPYPLATRRRILFSYWLSIGENLSRQLPDWGGEFELLVTLGGQPGLLRSQISCVEGGRSTTMRELKVQIGNSGITSTKPAKRRTLGDDSPLR